MSKHESVLKKYMTGAQLKKLGTAPTTHRNCIDACEVARPGKTARDKANGSHHPGKNVRTQDSKTKRFIRQRDGSFVS